LGSHLLLEAVKQLLITQLGSTLLAFLFVLRAMCNLAVSTAILHSLTETHAFSLASNSSALPQLAHEEGASASVVMIISDRSVSSMLPSLQLKLHSLEQETR
jgi:hypothetical protein